MRHFLLRNTTKENLISKGFCCNFKKEFLGMLSQPFLSDVGFSIFLPSSNALDTIPAVSKHFLDIFLPPSSSEVRSSVL